jgi:hypothetical protein
MALSDKLKEAGCEVNGDGDYVVKLASELFGNEYNCYETLDEAVAGLRRVYEVAAGLGDGVDREIALVFGWPLDLDYLPEDEDEDDDQDRYTHDPADPDCGCIGCVRDNM